MVLPKPSMNSNYSRKCINTLRMYFKNNVGIFSLLGFLEISALTRHADRDR